MGKRFNWGAEAPFGLRVEDRRQHLYVIGKTGSGKTTLLRNLIVQDIAAGRGLAVIDPHGDLASELLDYVPGWRTDDVVYLDPADVDHPVALNLLHRVGEGKHLVASGIVGAFKCIWGDSWGPRLEYILYATVAALLDCENTSLLGLPRMLVDERYRHWVVRQVKDPVVRSFWEKEFVGYDRRFLNEAIAPIQNKVGQLLMAAPVRNILGQVRSRIDARFLMDSGRILIANLAKGRIEEDKANLVGAVLLSQLQNAALSRADQPEQHRRDFFLFVDEFHNFATDSFASMLAEARKYRLNLTLSHQYIAQLRPSIREAVLGNVGSLVSFRVGERDASVLEQELGGEYNARQLTELGNHEVCVRLLQNGEPGAAFLGTTLPPLPMRCGRRDTIVRRSRERFGTERTIVEEKIRRWMKA